MITIICFDDMHLVLFSTIARPAIVNIQGYMMFPRIGAHQPLHFVPFEGITRQIAVRYIPISYIRH